MKIPSNRLVEFFEPICKDELLKGAVPLICFFNLGGALLATSIEPSIWKNLFIGMGIVLSMLSFYVIKVSRSNIIKAIYGFYESILMIAFAYYATYSSYVATGNQLKEYLMFTQLMGWFITIIYGAALIYRLIGPEKKIDIEQIAKGFIIGYFVGIGFIIFIFGGLIILYYTVFKQNINLVESSKMLYVAFGMHVGVAYYGLKVFFTIKYRKYIAENLKQNIRNKKNRKSRRSRQ